MLNLYTICNYNLRLNELIILKNRGGEGLGLDHFLIQRDKYTTKKLITQSKSQTFDK